MANTSPNTYITKRVPFVGNPDQRTGASISKDQIFINFYATDTKSIDGPKYQLEQRAGLVYQQGIVSGVGRGVYYWNNKTYVAIGNGLYADGSLIETLATSTGTVGFQEFRNDVNQNFLIVLDGIAGYVIADTGVVTPITSPNFPTPHVVHAGYIDGYLVVAKAGTADLYNSNLLDPLTWTAGDFISAEVFPDNVVAVCRQNNYIVAVGSQTTEFFYDAGTAPGTPLARNSAALHQFGTPAPDTVIQTEEQVIFVGQTGAGGRTVWVLNGFTPTDISTQQVRESLDNEGVNIANAKAFCVRSKGHKFYVLNLTSLTWVFDFDTQMWHQWADYTGTAKFPCDYASDSFLGGPIMLDRTKGFVYKLTEGVAADSQSSFSAAALTCIAISDKFDFGTMNNKFMHRLAIVCDTPFGNNQTSCTLYWTDDDYQTYSSGRTIQFSNTMPVITQLGKFRRRAFKLVYNGEYPLRLEGLEMDINIGAQ